MIRFKWHGVDTIARIYYGRWAHGLPEVVAMLDGIADPSKPNALQLAAERLGGEVVSEIPTGEVEP